GSATELRPGGLLRTGFELEPAEADRADGFIIYDVRLALTGVVGYVFDYTLGVEYDRDDAGIDLLDAVISFPVGGGDAFHADLGGFRSPVSREALTDKALLPFVERSQSALALAPGRQLGLQLRGTAMDSRFSAAAGVFNGNGLRLENDDKSLLAAARVAYNSVGEIEFFEDFVIEAGLNLAWSRDSAQAVLPIEARTTSDPGARRLVDLVEYEGHRLTWGGDARLAYRGWTLAAEYLRTDYDPDAGLDAHADGVTVDLRHLLWGAFDVGVRYDGFTPAVGIGGAPPETSRFLIAGLGVAPGLFARVGMQYAFGIDGTTRGVSGALDGTNTAPPLTNDQFLLYLQLAF
ncbi:MAG: porin, partial [Gemmatimonadota bacterium]